MSCSFKLECIIALIAIAACCVLRSEGQPELIDFVLDLNNAQLSLTFDREVDTLTCNVSELALTNSNASAYEFPLTNATCNPATVLPCVVSVILTEQHVADLQSDSTIATSVADTFLVMADFIEDDSGNGNVPIPQGMAIQAFKVFPLTVDPPQTQLLMASLMLGDGQIPILLLSFDMNVNDSTCDITQMTLLNSPAIDPETIAYNLTGGICTSPPANQSILSVSLDLADFQQIMMLFNSSNFLNLAFGTEFVQDINGFYVAPVNPSNAVPIVFVGVQTAFPDIVDAMLDLDSGQITLEFVSNVSLIVPTSFIVTSEVDLYQLTGAKSFSPSNMTQSLATIDLVVNDLNMLKVLVGESIGGVNLTLSEGAVQLLDGTMNMIITLPLTILPDGTSPMVGSFVLDMDVAVANITFSEPMDQDVVNISQVYIGNSSNLLESSVYSLGSSTLTETNFFTFSINLTLVTLNTIKQDLATATSDGNSYLYLKSSSFRDVGGNPVEENITIAHEFIPDTTSPSLIFFSLDLDDGVLSLTFSEPILPTSVNLSEISLVDLTDSSNSHILPQSLMQSFKEFDTVMEVVMVGDDLSDIKLFVLSLSSTTGLAMMTTTVQDTNFNPVIETLSPLENDKLINDITAPEMVNFFLVPQPPQTYSLTMVFDEYIDKDSFNPSEMVLTMNTALGSLPHSFSGGVVTMDGANISYTFGTSELSAELPIVYQVAYYSGNFSLNFSDNLATDLSGNAVQEPPALLLFTSMATDPAPPAELISFNLSLEINLLIMEFSREIVVLNAVNTIIFSADQSLTTMYVLSSNGYASLGMLANSTIEVPLLTLDALALISSTSIASDPSNTFLKVSSNFAIDYSGNQVVDKSPIKVHTLTPNSPPEIDSAMLDINAGSLVLSFTENVEMDTFVVTGIQLFKGQVKHSLTSSNFQYTTPVTNASITITLSLNDLNALKILQPDLTWNLSAEMNTFTDDDGVSNNFHTLLLAEVVQDTTPPMLMASVFNLSAETLELTFDEPISESSVNSSLIYITNVSTDKAQGSNLEGSVDDLVDNETILFHLSKATLNNLKADVTTATNISNTHVFLASGSVADYAGNTVLQGTTSSQVTMYVPDTIPPVLDSFSVDLDAGRLVMTFSEPVQSSNLLPSGISLAAKSSSSDPPLQPTAVNGVVLNPQPLSSVLTLTLTNVDAIKLALTSTSVACLEMESSTATDFNGNPVVAIPSTNCLNSSSFFPDVSLPTVVSIMPAAPSLDTQSILFEFNEYINDNSLSIESVSIEVNTSSTHMAYSGVTNGVWTTNGSNIAMYHFSNTDLSQPNFASTYFIASRSGTIAVSFGPGLAEDLAGNPVAMPSSPLVFDGMLMDNSPPSLDSFSLNLINRTLDLTFSEEVILFSISNNLQIQNMLISPTSTFTLNSAQYASQDNQLGMAFTLNLTLQDVSNLINKPTLAVNTSNTYLSPSGNLVIDYGGNLVDPATTAVQASFVITPGIVVEVLVLLNASLDLDGGILTLEFDMEVDSSTLLPAGISLSNSLTSYQLQGHVIAMPTSNNGTAILLSSADLNAVKFLRTTLNVTLAKNAILSVGGAGNQDQTAPFSAVIEDSSDPGVVEYTMDLDAALLSVTFTEPMSNANYNTSKIFLSGSLDSSPSGYQLVGALLVGILNHSTILQVALPEHLLVEIKADSSIVTSVSNTYLFVAGGAFEDISGHVLPGFDHGIPPTTYFPDATSPQLISFVIDLNGGKLSLTFDEPMNKAGFDPLGMKIFNSDLSAFVMVADFTLESANFDRKLDLLLLSSLNDLKVLIVSGSLQASLSVSPTTISDVAGNSLAEIPESSPLTSESVILDSTRPSLHSFVAGDGLTPNLTFVFNEYVEPSSWDGNSFTLFLNTTFDLISFPGFVNGTVTTNVSETITYEFAPAEFQPLFSTQYLQAYYSGYIAVTFTASLVSDISGNEVLPQNEQVIFNSMTSDAIQPQFESFSIDLDQGTLMMTFSELVIVKSVQGNVRLQDSSVSPSQVYTLTSDAYSSQHSSSGQVITVDLITEDLVALNNNPNIATTIADTYLHLTSSFVSDPSGNFLVAIATAVKATTVVPAAEPTEPRVMSFDLDLDSDQLTLSFDSPVIVSTLMSSRITLVNTSTVTTQTEVVAVTNVTVLAQGEQESFRLLLSTGNIVSIKRGPLCYTTEDCFAVFEQGLIFNSAGLGSAAQSQPLQVSGFLPDVTPPRLLSFPVFDLNSGYFTLVFTEPVNGSSTDFAKVTFSNTNDNPSVSVTLTEGFTTPDHIEITFTMHRDDLNALKYQLELCTDRDNCWVQLPSFFISDIGSNPFLHMDYLSGTLSSFYQPSNFVADDNPPVIETYAVDLDGGKLSLSFDEVVNISLFFPENLTLLDAPSGKITLVLDQDSPFTCTEKCTVIEITLTMDNLNLIKVTPFMTSTEDSYMSLLSDITDVSFNTFANIHVLEPRKAGIFIPDQTPAMLISFNSFNIDNGTMYLIFNEPVDVETVNMSKITLVSGPAIPQVSYRLTGGSAYAVNNSKLGVFLELTVSDRVNIKLLSGLASSFTNTYIAIDELFILDTSDNTNAAISALSPVKLSGGGFKGDSSRAAPLTIDLDMDQGWVTVVFSDVIDAQSVNPAQLTLQNRASQATTIYSLSLGSTVESPSSDIVLISMALADLNNIKQTLDLAGRENETFFSFPDEFATDIEGRQVIGILAESAQPVSVYVMDTTPPQLLNYQLDVDTGMLELTFDEPTLVNSLNPTMLTFQNNVSSPTGFYQLKFPGEASPRTMDELADEEVLFKLNNSDLNAIKSITSLATVASNTFITVTGSFITDSGGNQLQPVVGLETSSYTPDTTLPELLYFDLDLTQGGTLILKFSESVNFIGTLQNTITLQSSESNPSVSFMLESTETASQIDVDEISIILSSVHTNQLLSDPGIASSTGQLFISMESGGVYDYSGGAGGQGQSIAAVVQRVRYLFRICYDDNTYNNQEDGTCYPCSDICFDGCTGMLAIAGEGGCNKCGVIVYDSAGEQEYCLALGSDCPPAYYDDQTQDDPLVPQGGKSCRPCHEDCAACTGSGSDQCMACLVAFTPVSPGLLRCLDGCDNTNAVSCQVCDVQCNGCTGPGNTNCLGCHGNDIVDNGQVVCVPACGEQEYLQEASGIYFCLPCHAQCNGCFGPEEDDCQRCVNYNNTFNGANECSEVCPFGSYPNTSNVCQACDEQCSGCTGPSNANCTACVANQMLLPSGETVCVSSCPTWQEYDIITERCILSDDAELAVIIGSSVGGLLIVLCVLITACYCVCKCRSKVSKGEYSSSSSAGDILLKRASRVATTQL